MEDSLTLTMEHVLGTETICRVCLIRGEGMQPLFVEEGIISQIEYCTGIRLLNEPSLPSHICPPCLTNLSVSHSFKSTCLSSHHTLHPHAQILLITEPVSVKVEKDDSMDMDNDEVWVKEERKKKLKKEKEDRKNRKQTQQSKNEYIYTENNQTIFVNLGNSFPTNNSVRPSSVSSTSSVPDYRIPGDSAVHKKTPRKRSKKGLLDSASWEIDKAKNKKARESGKPYLSQKRLKGIRVGFETRKERKMGPPCHSTLCRKSAKRRCDIIKDKDRKYCFNKFWTDLNWDEKKQYVIDLVDVTSCKKVNGESRRTKTIKYNLEVNNECWPVCKKMFLNTLSVGEKTVLGWLEKACEAAMSEDNPPPDIKPPKVFKRGPYKKKSTSRRPKFKFRRLWCSICEIQFDTKEESDAHRLATHPDPDPWMCEICGKVFNHRGSHYTHVRSHLPPLHGCAHCDYKTWHRHDLVKHLRIHEGVKQYQCTQCARTFHTSSNLTSHIKRLHLRARPYQCSQCQRRFFDRTKLRRHMDSHNDIKRFECEVCHSCFTRRCYWKKHLQKQHGVVVPPQRPGRQKVNFLVGEELMQENSGGDVTAKHGR